MNFALGLVWGALLSAQAEAPELVDGGALLEATTVALAAARDPVRVALFVEDEDVLRRARLERALLRALRERQREDVITAAYVRGVLDDNAEAQLQGGGTLTLQALVADHLLFARVVLEGDSAILELRTAVVATGEVVGSSRVPLAGPSGVASAGAGGNSAQPLPLRSAVQDVADDIAEALELRGTDVRRHRLALAPVQGTGAAAVGRVDRFVEEALLRALAARGFLLVERARLGAAIEQLALGQALDEAGAPAVGKLVGAQSLLVARVAEDGTSFAIDARVIDVEHGQVLGATRARVPRNDVVTAAAVEMRTPLDAGVQSGLVAGWGQMENRRPLEAVLFGVGVYGALATTLGLAVGAGLTHVAYEAVAPGDGLSASAAAARAVELREQRDTLVIGSAIAGSTAAGLGLLNIVHAMSVAPGDAH